MHFRSSAAFAIPFVSLALFFSGCGSGSGPTASPDTDRLRADLEATRQKLAAVEKELAAKNDEIAKTSATSFVTDLSKKEAAPAALADPQKDAQIQSLQAEIAKLKKQDSVAFAQASATHAKGITTITLDRYQQFVKDYPNSPLVVDANRAIAELNGTSEREAKWRANLIDPKRPERDLLKRFSDGVATAEEIAPLLKRRTSAEVVKLLGNPNREYRNGSEVGYVDRIIDSRTGNKDTLVIIFDEDSRVTSVRIGYNGREIKP
jgi:hypothetical protein